MTLLYIYIYMVVQFLLFFDIFLFIHDGIMLPLDPGFASCDSCEKEYVNKLPRLCWVMTVTSGWPYGFSPSTLFTTLRNEARSVNIK